MREILFRGVIIGENNYTYSEGFLKHKDGTIIIISDQNEEKFQTSPIELSSFGEFIGVNDRNGSKIFEGDIIGFQNDNIKYIVAKEDQGFVLKTFGGQTLVYNINPNIIEVLGNFYENPELLK